MRTTLSLVLIALLFSCNDDSSFDPDGTFSCVDLADGWSAESEPHTNYHYPEHIAFGSPELGIGVSKAGQITRTTDGGINWTTVESGVVSIGVRNEDAVTSARLRTVTAVNENLFYAAGDDEDAPRSGGDIETDAVFLISKDGGLVWSKRYLAGFTSVDDLRFLNENRGYAVAQLNEGSEDQSRWLFTTEDGGENWTPVEVPFGRHRLSYRFIQRPDAISVVAESADGTVVLLTNNPSDGSWESTSLPVGYLGTIQFTTREFGLAPTSSALWITTDGGISWEERNFIEATDFTHLYAADERNWLVIKEIILRDETRFEGAPRLLHYEVLATADGGNTWTNRKVDPDCHYELPFQVTPTRTPTGGFLTVTSRANLITFNN